MTQTLDFFAFDSLYVSHRFKTCVSAFIVLIYSSLWKPHLYTEEEILHHFLKEILNFYFSVPITFKRASWSC